jgi:hypothetical protein
MGVKLGGKEHELRVSENRVLRMKKGASKGMMEKCT